MSPHSSPTSSILLHYLLLFISHSLRRAPCLFIFPSLISISILFFMPTALLICDAISASFQCIFSFCAEEGGTPQSSPGVLQFCPTRRLIIHWSLGGVSFNECDCAQLLQVFFIYRRSNQFPLNFLEYFSLLVGLRKMSHLMNKTVCCTFAVV